MDFVSTIKNEFLKDELEAIICLFDCEILLITTNPNSIIVQLKITANKFSPYAPAIITYDIPNTYPMEMPTYQILWENENSGHFFEDFNFFYETVGNDSLYDQKILETVNWISVNLNKYIAIRKPDKVGSFEILAENDKQVLPEEKLNFSRIWIYSHHIYNPAKRTHIIQNARQLELSGFCVPGKPGVVLVEGRKEYVDLFWKGLCALNWKRIVIKERLDFEDLTATEFEERRVVKGFEEKDFTSKRGVNYHVDIGRLGQFMADLGVESVFAVLFGVTYRKK